MKHKLKIGVLLLSLFLLVGCDKVPQEIIDKIPDEIKDEIEDLLPSVDLKGEDVIHIVQNTEFIDPGVDIGDFDLEVDVVTDLDVTTVGEYTVTYNVIYEGITYSGTRTVMVIPPEEVINFLGDELMLVEQYTEFVDPGANVSVVGALELTVVSDVDTSVLGDYTITYSTTYNGVEYSHTRTVRVVAEKVLTDLGWVVESVSYGFDSISVHVYYDDPDGLLQNGKAKLYQGDTLVESYDINSGNNYLNFIELDDDTDYTFMVEGSYDDDGTLVVLDGYELMFTTDMYTTITVDTKNSSGTHNSVYTEIMVTDVSSNITSIVAYLYLDDAVVGELALTEGDTVFIVDGLLPSTEYDLKVAYTGPSNDDDTVVTIEIPQGVFLTDALPSPELILFLCEVEYTTADCGVGVDDTGLTDVALRVEVWKDGAYDSLFNATNFNTLIEVTDLEPGTEYTLKLYADYKVDGSDELIAYTLIHEETITTETAVTYATPAIENLVIITSFGTTNTVTVDFDLSDPDSAIEGSAFVRLFFGSSQSAKAMSVGHNTIVFDWYQIDYNRLFTLKFKADYATDPETTLWDTVFHEESFITIPEVEGESYTSMKSMYFHSDRIILQLDLDNPDDMNVEYVTVNGIKIYKDDFLFPSSNNTIYLNMGVETDYTDYTYHITNFAVTMSDESSYAVEYDQTITFRLQQPGDIDPDDSEVRIIEITTDDYTRSVSSSVDDYTDITIHLDNEYNLDVYSITIGQDVYLASQFEEESTAKQIVLSVEIDRYFNNFGIGGLVYIRNDVNIDAPSTNYNVESISIYGYYSEDTVVISTAAELNSIVPGANKYYYLAADLDLTDFPMEPIGTSSNSFQGVFDGNGHTISNYSYTSEEVDQGSNVYVGLFGKSNAYIYDLTIFNSDITVHTNENHVLNVGVLAGQSIGSIIDCVTLGDNTITITGMTQGYVGGLVGSQTGFVRDTFANTDIVIDGLDIDQGSSYDTYVGGLLGVAMIENIETSSSNGTITITNTVNNVNIVGGLIGRFYNSTSDYATRNYISNSFASVDIHTSNYGSSTGASVGGLVGIASNEYADNTEIINSYATGDIYSTNGYIGGLVGQNWALLTNSFATGNIDGLSGYTDRLAAYSTFNSHYTNCYVYDAQTVSYDGNPGSVRSDVEGSIVTASIDEYNSEDFYTRVLGWDTYFWDFSGSFFVTADILPIHK